MVALGIVLLVLEEVDGGLPRRHSRGKVTPESIAWLVVYHTFADMSVDYIRHALQLSSATVYRISRLL